jgi:thiol-disulfide isomerase/thioredoxin
LSKGIEALISRITADGPSAKRPPHIELEPPLRLLIACLLTLTLAACDKQNPAAPQGSEAAKAPTPTVEFAPSQAAGSKAPAASFTDADGKPVSLASFHGRPMLVNLWATWCAPCVAEMPSIDRLAASEKGRLAVVAISQDGNGLEAVAPFFAKAKIATLKPYLDKDNALMMALKAETLPTTILYDANGQERWRHIGKVDWDDPTARAALADLLAGKQVAS